MSFDARESSEEDGVPIRLYLFVYGGGPAQYLGYTDSVAPVTHQGRTYEPLPIIMDSLELAGGLDKTTLSIEVPRECALVTRLLAAEGRGSMAVTVFNGHVSEPEFAVFFTGRALGVQIDFDGTSTVQVESIQTTLRRVGLRRHFQRGCPLPLYSAPCGASEAAATRNVTLSAVADGRIVLASGWAGSQPEAKFRGGLVRWTSAEGPEQRTIADVLVDGGTGDGTLALVGGTGTLAPGAAVQVLLGCAKTLNDCRLVHVSAATGATNAVNFGGQPWIPLKNPVGYASDRFS